jgi:transcriptional regulator with XRE-family HTH domain
VNLNRLREHLRVTQTTVAEQMGVSQSRVSRIERSDIGSLELGTMLRYIEALGCRAEIFVEFSDESYVLYQTPRLVPEGL